MWDFEKIASMIDTDLEGFVQDPEDPDCIDESFTEEP